MARCYLALWEGMPAAFCATLPVIGRRRHWRISRIVTLPDYQGIGIGMRVAEAVGDSHRAEGHRFNVTAGHPSLIAHCRRSPSWRAIQVEITARAGAERLALDYRGSAGRAVVSFEYLGPAAGFGSVGQRTDELQLSSKLKNVPDPVGLPPVEGIGGSGE